VAAHYVAVVDIIVAVAIGVAFVDLGQERSFRNVVGWRISSARTGIKRARIVCIVVVVVVVAAAAAAAAVLVWRLKTILRMHGRPHLFGGWPGVAGVSLRVLEKVDDSCGGFGTRSVAAARGMHAVSKGTGGCKGFPSTEDRGIHRRDDDPAVVIAVCTVAAATRVLLEGPDRGFLALADATVPHPALGLVFPELARRAQIDLEVGEKGRPHDFFQEGIDRVAVGLLGVAKGRAALGDDATLEAHAYR